jgi:hypothetical protein
MKKVVRVLLIVASTFVVIILLAALLISPIAENYIEKHSKELTGRLITMDKLKFNIFTGSLRINGFDMKEADDSASFFKFDTLRVDMNLPALIANRISVRRVILTGPELIVLQKGESFNFEDLMKRFVQDDTTSGAKADTTSSYEILLKNIEIKKGHILYRDLEIDGKWDLRNFALAIPEVFFSGRSTDIGFSLAFADGGNLVSGLKYNMDKSEYILSLKLNGLSVSGITPYVKQFMRIGALKGSLSSDITVTGDTEHVMDFRVKGNASIENFALTDTKGAGILTLKSGSVAMTDVCPGKSIYILDKLTADGLVSGITLEKDSSTNFSNLMIEDGAEADTSAPMVLKIKNLIVENSALTFKDRTPVTPFDYKLWNISLMSENFDMDGRNEMTIKGNVGNTGTASVRWRGSVSDMANQSLMLNVTNVTLKEFTPYTLSYFAYPLSRGNASFKSRTTLKNNNLTSSNTLDVYRIEVDKKRKELKPEYNIPMKTALYILKDKHDKIGIDLPVTGNVNDPQFSYKKIIFKVFVNLIVKVATAPVSFLADAMGLNGDKLSNIEFWEDQRNFTNEQYDTFNQLAQMSASKPELQLDIIQYLNYRKACENVALQHLRREFRSKKSGLNFENIPADSLNRLMTAYADSLLGPGQALTDILAGKAMVLYKNELPALVKESADARNSLLNDYLTTKLMLKPESFKIRSSAEDPQMPYDGKSLFKVTFIMPGDNSNQD